MDVVLAGRGTADNNCDEVNETERVSGLGDGIVGRA